MHRKPYYPSAKRLDARFYYFCLCSFFALLISPNYYLLDGESGCWFFVYNHVGHRVGVGM